MRLLRDLWDVLRSNPTDEDAAALLDHIKLRTPKKKEGEPDEKPKADWRIAKVAALNRPGLRLWDKSFVFRHGGAVTQTWRRFGFKPTTYAQRRAQQLKTVGDTEYRPMRPEELPSRTATVVTEIRRKATS